MTEADVVAADLVASRAWAQMGRSRRAPREAPGMPRSELDPHVLTTLRVLAEHRVEHVLAGEAAKAVHSDGGFVDAVTVVPSGYARNVDRLSAALRALHATARAAGTTVPDTVDLSPAALRRLSGCVLATDHADLVVDFEPPGTAGYVDLFANARRTHLTTGVEPHVAAREDLERMELVSRASAPTASPSAGRARARGRAPVPPR